MANPLFSTRSLAVLAGVLTGLRLLLDLCCRG